MPYCATADDIFKFLGELASCILPQGIHFVLNNQVFVVSAFRCQSVVEIFNLWSLLKHIDKIFNSMSIFFIYIYKTQSLSVCLSVRYRNKTGDI